MLKFLKGHYSVKNVDGLTVPVVCTSHDNAPYFTKFHENISKGFRAIQRTWFPYPSFQREITVENAGRVTVNNFCKLSDDALYLFHVS